MGQKDITEKTLENFNDVYWDIINVLLFQDVCGKDADEADKASLFSPQVLKPEILKQQVLKPEVLLEQATLRSAYKADKKLREQERDTAKYLNHANIHLALIGLENETQPEDDIPLRIIGYDGASYRDQLFYVTTPDGIRRRNQNPRYPVITLLLYFGYEKRWDKPLTLLEALHDNIPKKLIPYVNDYKVNLFEIAWLTDAQVMNFKSDFRIVADYFVQMRKNRDYIPPLIPFVHVREVLQLMSVLTGDSRFEDAYNETSKGDECRNMCEVLDRIENRGIEKGRIEGLRDGRLEGLRDGRIEGLRDGRLEGRILEFIDLRREAQFSDPEISAGLMKKFDLTNDQAKKYLKETIKI